MVTYEELKKALRILSEARRSELKIKELINNGVIESKAIKLAQEFFEKDEERMIEFLNISDLIISGVKQPSNIDELTDLFKNYLFITGELPRILSKRYWEEVLGPIYSEVLELWESKDKLLEEEISEELEELTELTEKLEEAVQEKHEEKIEPVINLKEEAHPKKEYEVEFSFPKEIDWDKIKEEVKKEPQKIEIVEEKKEEDKKNLANI